MGTGVEEVAAAESAKGATEAAGFAADAAATDAFGADALGAWSEGAGAYTGGEAGALADAAAAGESVAAGTAAGTAADAGALGNAAELGNFGALGDAAASGGNGVFNAAADSQLASTQLGITGAESAASAPSSIPTGGAGDLTGAGMPDATGTLPDANPEPPTGMPDGGSAPAYGGPGTPGAGAGTDEIVNGRTAIPGLTGNSSIDRALKALGITSGKDVLQAANVGLGAASLFKQLAGGNQAQKQFQQIAGPANQAAQKLLSQFQSGQLSAADAFQIAQYTQQQKAGVNQYYAKAGLSNSSMHQQALQQIDTQAEAMRSQQVENMLKQGLAAAGVANPVLTQGVTASLNSDAEAMKQMREFISTMAKMNTQTGKPDATSQTGSPEESDSGGTGP